MQKHCVWLFSPRLCRKKPCRPPRDSLDWKLSGGVIRLVGPRGALQALFGKTADSLERSTENEDEYMIHEREVRAESLTCSCLCRIPFYVLNGGAPQKCRVQPGIQESSWPFRIGNRLALSC